MWPKGRAGRVPNRDERKRIAKKLTGIKREPATVHRLADAHDVGPVTAARAALATKRSRKR